MVDSDSENRMLLITYQTASLSPTNKVRFYYALKGRDKKSGITKLYDINHLAKQVFMISSKYKEDMKMFFLNWKIPYDVREIVLESYEEVKVR